MMEGNEIQKNALKFLYQSEIIDDPLLINNLKMNILMQSSFIKEVEMLAVSQTKQLLIYVELGFIGRLLFEKRIQPPVLEIVQQLLPNFKVRVVQDLSILEKSKEKVEKILKISQK